MFVLSIIFNHSKYLGDIDDTVKLSICYEDVSGIYFPFEICVHNQDWRGVHLQPSWDLSW